MVLAPSNAGAGRGRLPGGGHRPAGLRAVRQARRRRTTSRGSMRASPGSSRRSVPSRCVIAGHDWGGLLVWPFARRYPELLAGVVGVNTPDLPRMPMAPTALLRMAFPDEPPYLIQFQDRGPAEYLLGRDIRAILRGDVPWPGDPTARGLRRRRDRHLRRAVLTERRADPAARVLPQPRPQLGTCRRRCRRRSTCRRLMVSAADDPVLTPAMSEGMEERVRTCSG